MHTIIQTFKIIAICATTAISTVLAALIMPFGKTFALYNGTKIWSKLILELCGVNLSLELHDSIDWKKPKIFVANHQSHIDIPVLLFSLPIPLYFIAKQELKHIPFLGWFMQLAGMIFIDRSNKDSSAKSMNLAAQRIKQGQNIISFPEGTRSVNSTMQPFKRGTFKIALKHNIEIVPIAIVGAGNIIPANSFDIRSGKVHIQIGSPISSQGWESVEEYALYTQKKVEELHSQGLSKLNEQQEYPALFI